MAASFGEHICLWSQPRECPAGCSWGLTAKRPTTIKALEGNYGDGPPGREQRYVAQGLRGIWKAHPDTSPRRKIYEADVSDAISASD